MTIPAAGTVFSFAPQSAKIGDGVFNVGSHTWRRYPVPRIDGGGTQNQTPFPQEMDNVIVPKGEYKSGAFVMMENDIIPRLENVFGYLLEAALGAVSSVTDHRYHVSGFVPTVGVNTHIFSFDPSNSSYLPWLALRRSIPGSQSSDTFGEVMYDCRVAAMRLTIPGGGLITSRFSFQGLRFFQPLAVDVNNWTYANSFESSETHANAGRGLVRIGSETPTLTALVIDLDNGLSTPQQEQVVGSYFPEDTVSLFRSVNMRATVKWKNPTLWRQLFNGGPSNVDWSALPYAVNTNGATKAFYAEFYSPDNIPGTAFPYCLKIIANKVITSVDRGSIQLQAGDIVRFNINIAVHQPTAGDYITFVLENAQSSYSWS